MKIVVEINLVHSTINAKIETFRAEIKSTKHSKLVKLNQAAQKKKIIEYFKTLKAGGLITSLPQPKNKTMQDTLDKLNFAKKRITKTIKQLNQIFR